jgi:hypothetical protein
MSPMCVLQPWPNRYRSPLLRRSSGDRTRAKPRRRVRSEAVAETSFSIAYDGPALETGRMPVRDLAPALLALGELFTEASQIVYPDADPVALSIKATEQGSFEVHLILEGKDLWDQFVNLFGSDPVTALVNLKTLIAGGGTVSPFWPHQDLGRTPCSAGGTADSLWRGQDHAGRWDVPGDPVGRSQDVPPRLYSSEGARRRCTPHSRRCRGSQVAETPTTPPELVIKKEDLPAYEEAATEEGDVLLDEEREMVLQIAAVSFEEGHKWRLSDGTVTFWVSVEDAEFLAEVDRRIERCEGRHAPVPDTSHSESAANWRTQYGVPRRAGAEAHSRRRAVELGGRR